ncbi:hypothetical protein [Paenibacillus turpanensis]|uniref:hypothetical protein n=1 Tax=Paenibacillus turpanensis TaxID=2689078 RepID=UPI001FB6A84F|nr:hypothetical protein [Paenibacillus turpanensis]
MFNGRKATSCALKEYELAYTKFERVRAADLSLRRHGKGRPLVVQRKTFDKHFYTSLIDGVLLPALKNPLPSPNEKE